MAEDDDLLQKADALMRRHRPSLADAAGRLDEGAVAFPSDDIPVLTEVVAPAGAADTAVPEPIPVPAADLRDALAGELEAWLDKELPQHVMRVLDGVTDHLIAELSVQARADLLPRLQGLLSPAPLPAKPDPADD